MVTEKTKETTGIIPTCERSSIASDALIYIGKNLEKPVWYFVSNKDGYRRFLQFGFAPFYPFWIGGVNTGTTHTVPDRLSQEQCPQEAWDEVKLFVGGKVSYEFVPSKKGRKASVIRKTSEAVGELGRISETTGQPDRTDDIPPRSTAGTKSGSKSVRGSVSGSDGSNHSNRVSRDASESKRGRNLRNSQSAGRGQVQVKSVDGTTSQRIRKERREGKLHKLVVNKISDSHQSTKSINKTSEIASGKKQGRPRRISLGEIQVAISSEEKIGKRTKARGSKT